MSCGVCRTPQWRDLSLLGLRMVKAFFPKGISERVKAAVIRRLQSAMASSASRPETGEVAMGEATPGEVNTIEENPPQSVTPAPPPEEPGECRGRAWCDCLGRCASC